MSVDELIKRIAIVEANNQALRYALATARDTDCLFSLIRICDNALARHPKHDTELLRRDLCWIREIERLRNKLKEYGVVA